MHFVGVGNWSRILERVLLGCLPEATLLEETQAGTSFLLRRRRNQLYRASSASGWPHEQAGSTVLSKTSI